MSVVELRVRKNGAWSPWRPGTVEEWRRLGSIPGVTAELRAEHLRDFDTLDFC